MVWLLQSLNVFSFGKSIQETHKYVPPPTIPTTAEDIPNLKATLDRNAKNLMRLLSLNEDTNFPNTYWNSLYARIFYLRSLYEKCCAAVRYLEPRINGLPWNDMATRKELVAELKSQKLMLSLFVLANKPKNDDGLDDPHDVWTGYF